MTAHRRTAEGAAEAEGLQRTLGLWQLTVSGVGIVIGAGIYVLIGEAARDAGSAVWLAFVVAALLASLTGLGYAELASMFPSAGAEYEFARRAFGDFAGFMAGWMMIAGNAVGGAAVAIGFAEYLRHFVGVDAHAGSLALLALLTTVVIGGLRRSIWLTAGLVVLQIGGLLLVIAAGAPHLGSEPLLEGASAGGVLSAAALVFFAFIGFDEVVTLSDETRDAARVVPRALLLALGISTLLYVAVGVAAVSAIGGDALGHAERPLALVMQHDWGGRAAGILAAIALAATTNTTLLVLTAASRLLYSMARGGSLPRWLGRVGQHGHAPWAAALVAFAIAAPFALSGQIEPVAAATNFALYVIFLIVNLAVITLRFRHPALPRPFRAPLSLGRLPLLPALGLVVTLAMMAFLEPQAWLLGGGLLLAGVAAWALSRRGAHAAP